MDNSVQTTSRGDTAEMQSPAASLAGSRTHWVWATGTWCAGAALGAENWGLYMSNEAEAGRGRPHAAGCCGGQRVGPGRYETGDRRRGVNVMRMLGVRRCSARHGGGRAGCPENRAQGDDTDMVHVEESRSRRWLSPEVGSNA